MKLGGRYDWGSLEELEWGSEGCIGSRYTIYFYKIFNEIKI